MSTIVGFNAASCDPISEGEALAEVITDAVHENDSAAIVTLLQAAECLGAEFVRLDEVIGNDLVDVLYENDAWRHQLKVAIARAEDLVAADAPLKCVACGSPRHDDCGQQ